jgi:hypothetical protein
MMYNLETIVLYLSNVNNRQIPIFSLYHKPVWYSIEKVMTYCCKNTFLFPSALRESLLLVCTFTKVYICCALYCSIHFPFTNVHCSVHCGFFVTSLSSHQLCFFILYIFTIVSLMGAGNFSLHHGIQKGSGVHPASYPVGTWGSFPGDKAART